MKAIARFPSFGHFDSLFPMRTWNRSVSTILAFALLASGAAGLVFEIDSIRFIGLILGHDGHASLVVLVAFMGGLALGNLWFGRRVERLNWHPLVVFAAIECAIGSYALFFPSFQLFGQFLYSGWAYRTGSSGFSLLLLKLSFASGLVLPASFLMGGTLPVIAGFLQKSRISDSLDIAWVYAVNSLGAVAGCMLADLFTIPSYGLTSTLHVTAVLNFSAATGGAIVSKAWPLALKGGAVPVENPKQRILHAAAVFQFPFPTVLWIAGLSGFAAMVYEVVWMRILALVLGSTTHAFAFMVSAFIGGIALGSLWVSRRSVAPQPLKALGWSQGALAIVVAAYLPVFGGLPFIFARAASYLATDVRAYPAFAGLQAVVCLGVMIPPTLLLGAALPLAVRVGPSGGAMTSIWVGAVFSANTFGSVGGAILTALHFMPGLGLAGALGVGIGVNLAASAMAFGAIGSLPVRWSVGLGVVAVMSCPFLVQSLVGKTWHQKLELGLWRKPDSLDSYHDFEAISSELHIKYHRDGAAATVAVNAWNDGLREQLNLRVNGKTDASTAGDMATQLLLGHLPLLLHTGAKRALVVGLGSGVTAGAIAQHPLIEAIDTVEISPEVVDAARLFGDSNHHILDDPRLRVVVEDARSFLTRAQSYDVIVSEPSNPWIAGVAGLFTQEFYAKCRLHLHPDGFMVQWVHLYDNQQAALDLIVRTLSTVFPFVSVWQSQQRDLILVASLNPQPKDPDFIISSMQVPAVQSDLTSIGLERPVTLFARQLISDTRGKWLVDSGGPLQLDDRPRLEYLAQSAFFAHQDANQWLELDENRFPRPDTLLARDLKVHGMTTEDYKAMARGYLRSGLPGPQLLRSLRIRWQSDPHATGQLELYPQLPPLGTSAELEALRLANLREEILAKAESNRLLARHYFHLLLEIYRSQRSVFLVPTAHELRAVGERLLGADPVRKSEYEFVLSELAWDQGDTTNSLKFGRLALMDLHQPNPLDPSETAQAIARHLHGLCTAGLMEESAGVAHRFGSQWSNHLSFQMAIRESTGGK